jgi:hypothetical protein
MARFWADCDLIHVSIGGPRVKTVRSHLSTSDLAKLVASGALPAGPAPLPGIEDGAALEVERVVSNAGLISLAGKQILVPERLGGIRIGVRIEEQTLLFFDINTPASCCAPARTRSPVNRSCGCLVCTRPGPHPDPAKNRSASSGAPPIPGSSWSPGKKSRSGALIAARKSRSSSPKPRLRRRRLPDPG